MWRRIIPVEQVGLTQEDLRELTGAVLGRIRHCAKRMEHPGHNTGYWRQQIEIAERLLEKLRRLT